MSGSCPKCGNKLKEGENFYTKCGHQITDEDKGSNKVEGKTLLNIDTPNFKIISLILTIISLIVTVLMALGLPMLVLDSAILLAVSGVIGGIGILICIRKEEFLMGSICSFAGLIMCFMSAYLMSIIPCIFFLITAIFLLIGGQLRINNKIFWIIPIVIIVIPFLILGLSLAGTGNGDDIKVANINHNITESYGYCSGDISFELTSEKNYDDLQVTLTYYDDSGKVIYTDKLVWNQIDVKPGTYKINAMYFEKEMPKKATLEIFDQFTNTDPIYSNNITFGV